MSDDERNEDDLVFDLQTPSEVAWERSRQASLRSFRVTLRDGSVVFPMAHYWSNENPAGHLNFYTVTPGGRHVIHDAYNARDWKYVTEVTPAETSRVIDRATRRSRDLEAVAGKKPRPTKPRVH